MSNKDKIIQNNNNIILNNHDLEEILIKIKQMSKSLEASEFEYYEGEYDITPLANQQQELETKNKLMSKNLIIKEVPFFEVSNNEGTTVYIGSEV